MDDKKRARPSAGTPRRAKRESHRAGGNPYYQNTTDRSGGQADTISGLLLHGAENGLHLRHLCRLTGWKEREVRWQSHAERRRGIPILSDNVNGYFLPTDEQELVACVRSMRNRAGEILAAAEGIEGNVTAAQEAARQAASSASAASGSATAAAGSASTASTAAGQAQTAATNAGRSETNAANSASIAEDAKTAAKTAAGSASADATAAANAKTAAETAATNAEDAAERAEALAYSGAGAHNSVYRGKNLGSNVTAEQYAAIAAGTFDDLYIGDYWTIGGVNYRIAAFDYYYRCGDTEFTKHHIVVVPDTSLYNHVMNDTKTTTGAYVGSKMYTEGLEQAKTTINTAFSGHVLSKRIYLSNAVSDGRASDGLWYDSEVDLMCEHMVHGNGVFSPVSDGTTVPDNYRVEKSQLPLFQHEPSRICNRAMWWLRDVISAAEFAGVTGGGNASCHGADVSGGVRPAFCIGV